MHNRAIGESQRRQCNAFPGCGGGSVSSDLVAMQTLHGYLFRCQLQVCGCSASLLSGCLAIVQVNLCNDVLLLMCILWVVGRCGRVHANWRPLHWGCHVSQVLQCDRLLHILRYAAKWLLLCLPCRLSEFFELRSPGSQLSTWPPFDWRLR